MARAEDFPQPTPRNKTWNTAQRLKPEQARNTTGNPAEIPPPNESTPTHSRRYYIFGTSG